MECPRGPWFVTGSSHHYGGIVAAPNQDTDPLEVEAYGGRLIAESIRTPMRPHLSSWTPEVACAVADLLDAVGTQEAIGAAAMKLVATYPGETP